MLAFLVITPLFMLLLNSFDIGVPGQPTVYGFDAWQRAFTTPGIGKAIYNTFSLAVTRSLIATAIGIFIAWLLARTDIPLKGWFEFMFWISYFLPALPVALGWILLLDSKFGLINQWLMVLPFIDKPPLRNLFLLGDRLGPPDGNDDRHQGDAAHPGISQPRCFSRRVLEGGGVRVP